MSNKCSICTWAFFFAHKHQSEGFVPVLISKNRRLCIYIYIINSTIILYSIRSMGNTVNLIDFIMKDKIIVRIFYNKIAEMVTLLQKMKSSKACYKY